MDPFPVLEPVHRPEDGELVGHLSAGAVAADGDAGWRAHAVFGTALRTLPTREEAVAFLRARGLALLAERWEYTPDDGEPRTVWLVEARPGGVVVRFGDDPASVLVAGADLQRLTPA